MSYCLNPYCDRPDNPDDTLFCRSCGTKLLLKERYRSLTLIGQGGFGRTFLAVDEDKPSKPPCVIKQFFPQSQGTNNVQKAASLFEQEAVRLDELGKHPQIPELLAHFTQDNRQYLVQEFIDGQNLAQVMAVEGAFREPQIRDLLHNLLPVLEFIHSRNIIHRDIKPENIIRRRKENGDNSFPESEHSEQLVLVDFGAAKYAMGSALLKTGTSIGTPEYIAPEQAKGKAVFASDLYSLGVTCIHLLTQISPLKLFDTGEDAWVWRYYLATNSITHELERILDKLLQNATNRRYQSAAEVLDDLHRQPIVLTMPVQSVTPLPPDATEATTVLLPSSPTVKKSLNWIKVDTLKGHFGSVESVAISPDGQILASSSADQTIKLWQLQDRQELSTLNGHVERVNSVVFCPDGQTLVSGSYDQTIKIWQVSNGQEIRTLQGHTKWISSLAIHPDGEILASGSSDGTIKLWQLEQGRELYTLKAHTSSINAVAISPNGQILASVSGDGTVKLWQLSTGEELYTFGDGLLLRLGFFCSVAFSLDGQILAGGKSDGTIKLWHLQERREVGILKGHTERVRTVAFSPDGEILASGSMDKTIKVWHLTERQVFATLKGHAWEVYALAFSRDGQTLVSGSMDKTIQIWEVRG
ncbi:MULTISPECIES: serine/threonine-protein kinase [unclassified Coleofasciculus]|uniref:serine/threonine-protein kinase n=1 Tax=unclassified Coleofasciculus TaxID=2692782 RepID=UPI0018829C87|nr:MULTISPECIES: serine/threonine-protein kinase [unclassified Coleofasciculus]MBE9129057.1 serine/threonine protein kinase [Coleofasciculus sp. LEGE 07081]MBE9151739.1 serine/threonine protein kinase [Coleofasciculus sp. LEGE 07092]